MTNTKFFAKSKTVLGLVILAGSAFGFSLPFSEAEGAEIISLLEKLTGIILIIWGRQTAKGPLGLGIK